MNKYLKTHIKYFIVNNVSLKRIIKSEIFDYFLYLTLDNPTTKYNGNNLILLYSFIYLTKTGKFKNNINKLIVFNKNTSNYKTFNYRIDGEYMLTTFDYE